MEKRIIETIQGIAKKIKHNKNIENNIIFCGDIAEICDVENSTVYQVDMNAGFCSSPMKIDRQAFCRVKPAEMNSFCVSDDSLQIQAGKRRYGLPAIESVDPFEKIALPFCESPVEIDFENFQAITKKLKPAFSKDFLKMSLPLQGVYIDTENKALVATDSRRLHKQNFEFLGRVKPFVMPAHVVDILQALKQSGTIRLVDKKNYRVDFADFSLSIRYDDDNGAFPNWRAIMPAAGQLRYAWKIENRKKFLGELKELKDVANTEFFCVEFQTSENKVVGMVSSPDFGVFELETNIEPDMFCTGMDNQQIKLNVNYLIDSVKQFPGDSCIVELIDSTSQVLVRSNDSDFMAVIMPIKLY